MLLLSVAQSVVAAPRGAIGITGAGSMSVTGLQPGRAKPARSIDVLDICHWMRAVAGSRSRGIESCAVTGIEIPCSARGEQCWNRTLIPAIVIHMPAEACAGKAVG